jgi:hypothetical protein
MIILPGFYEQAPESLKKLLDADPHVRAYVSSIHEQMEKGEAPDLETASEEEAVSEHAA